jgi:23S rRNA pseudouridine1911/1915/1917 synthase
MTIRQAEQNEPTGTFRNMLVCYDPLRVPTLLDLLALQFPTAKRTTLRRMVAEGRVLLNDRRATRPNQPVADADRVRVVAGERLDPRRLIVPLRIVHEDADLLIVDKPAGLLTSTVPGEKRPTAFALVKRYVAATDPRAVVGLIHRLDRDASGLLVFSKSKRAYQSLKTQFFKHTVDRIYEAVVHGKPNPPKGTIDTRLIERADGTVRTVTEDQPPRGSQRAVTEYELLSSDKASKTSTLRVRLLTGRKHQIRAHLSERGCPIVGDRMYAKDKPQPDGPLRLRAVHLAFEHPGTGERIAFESD